MSVAQQRQKLIYRKRVVHLQCRRHYNMTVNGALILPISHLLKQVSHRLQK